MNFSTFKLWREQRLQADPGLMDCAETNLYRALADMQPRPSPLNPNRRVHRCDLARAWLHRYGFPDQASYRPLVCSGVRHALSLIFRELAKGRAAIWIARDVYPVYLELARAAAIEPLLFTTLPKPQLPARKSEGRLEYMLVTNPWKPLGRFLTDVECDALTDWLDASPGRQVLVDCVYDLGTPFHPTTQRLWETGRAILLHSFTKGWLSPKTFGVALIQGGQSHLDAVFRDNSPTQEQLAFAEKLISTHAELPAQVVAALKAREESLMAHLPAPVKSCLLLHPDSRSPGTYFFAVEINAEELLRQHEILAVPASAFGADWDGSVISSLAESFSSMKNVNPME